MEDAKEISLLMQDTIKRVNAEDKVAQGIQDKNRFTCVTVEDDFIVGVGALKGDEITAIYVSADHLGEGIGAKLLTYLEDRAFKKGIKKLRLESSLTAFQFYKKQ